MKTATARTALYAAITLGFAAPATAGDDTRLGPVEVTANRIELPVDQALASVTVLTREDIERSQAPDLLDLLSRQAGIDVARTGGAGQASTLFMRGSNSGHALVLVDGIRVNAATQGVFDLAHLPLAQLERIEIVRGPRAALWGSDAIGGVIQLFTRDPSRAFFQAEAGSYGRAGASAGGGGGHGDTRFGLAAGFNELRGFSATNPAAYGHDPDTDGYRNRNLSVHAQAPAGKQVLSFSGLLTSADVEFDQGRTSALNRVFGIAARGEIGSSWTHSLVAGHSSEDLDTPAYLSRFGSERDSLDWTNTIRLGRDDIVNVGANWSRESGYSLEAGEGFRRSRRNAALFGSWRHHAGAQLLEASVRHDDNSQFHGATTANLAWGWQAGAALRLRASVGQGFRAPDFNELFYPGFFGLFAGNPALRPERSRSAELGMDWRIDARQSLGLSLYRTRIDQLIAFQGVDFQAVNIARARVSGAELEYLLDREGLRLEANASWQDARDSVSGDRLLRRAPRKFNLSASHSFANQAVLGADWSAVAARPDFAGDRLSGYGRLDLRVSAPLAPQWLIEARVENLGDRDYELVHGYNTPGRSLVLNLRWDES